MSNNFAEHQTLSLNIKLLSITQNITQNICSSIWHPCILWWWRPLRLSRRNHQKYKPQMEQRSAGGMTSSNAKTTAKPSHRVVAVSNSLSSRFAVRQSQFGKFPLFFPYRYCIYSLSFMKASIKILKETEFYHGCRCPSGIGPPFRFGTPGPNPRADMEPPIELSENIIINVLVEIDNTLHFSAY